MGEDPTFESRNFRKEINVFPAAGAAAARGGWGLLITHDDACHSRRSLVKHPGWCDIPALRRPRIRLAFHNGRRQRRL